MGDWKGTLCLAPVSMQLDAAGSLMSSSRRQVSPSWTSKGNLTYSAWRGEGCRRTQFAVSHMLPKGKLFLRKKIHKFMPWIRRADREETGDALDGEKLCHVRCRKQSTPHTLTPPGKSATNKKDPQPPCKRLMLKEIQSAVTSGNSKFPRKI